MAINVPAAVNYPSPLVSLPARYNSEPSEGERFVPATITWGSMGGANNAVNFNLSINAAQTISQIVALSVDNSQNSSDIQFVFTDTDQTYTIPAYSPADVFPVFTNSLQFYVICPTGYGSDKTSFAVHNALPPPSNISATTELLFAGTGTASTANGQTQIIPVGKYGCIEAVQIIGAFSTLATGGANLSLTDGDGFTLAVTAATSNTTITTNAIILDLTAVRIRFRNGVQLNVSGSTLAGGTSVFAVNVFYRT